jgi:hypothetical protein
MTITLYWWFLPIALFLLPFGYALIRTDGGDYDMQIDTMLIGAAAWLCAIGVLIGKLVF